MSGENVSAVAELRRQMAPFISPVSESPATGNGNCDVLMIMMMMKVITPTWKVSHARLQRKMTLPPVVYEARTGTVFWLWFRCRYSRCNLRYLGAKDVMMATWM